MTPCLHTVLQSGDAHALRALADSLAPHQDAFFLAKPARWDWYGAPSAQNGRHLLAIATRVHATSTWPFVCATLRGLPTTPVCAGPFAFFLAITTHLHDTHAHMPAQVAGSIIEALRAYKTRTPHDVPAVFGPLYRLLRASLPQEAGLRMLAEDFDPDITSENLIERSNADMLGVYAAIYGHACLTPVARILHAAGVENDLFYTTVRDRQILGFLGRPTSAHQRMAFVHAAGLHNPQQDPPRAICLRMARALDKILAERAPAFHGT